ncbi:hypothetical protein IWQ62_000089 [Dispira parvispora]|uniref:Uncharacterized protein n=1 Tax=Dispira parvispora TaxID=1520584 RepID=A0A9W8AVK1_9FUNG|nr:hypothetical protein IWQ62_000089 [Dispira parvispora]
MAQGTKETSTSPNAPIEHPYLELTPDGATLEDKLRVTTASTPPPQPRIQDVTEPSTDTVTETTDNLQNDQDANPSLPRMSLEELRQSFKREQPFGLLDRLQKFLPDLQQANEELEQRLAQDGVGQVNIEQVDSDDEQYIEVDLGLGVFDAKSAPVTSDCPVVETDAILPRTTSKPSAGIEVLNPPLDDTEVDSDDRVSSSSDSDMDHAE